ncbi:MAG TPA: ferritin [Rhodospirillaceae bacterium]|nr:MAG: ferritin [Alphaproteobacteria bacterium GWF2_58_20]HAU29749.1 ferritin [Rhodospirillaceae bacterium]
MGSVGRKIIGMDIEELISLLNRAFADEWLAHYQYWMGAKLAKGPMKDAIIAELTLHAADEMRHATMVAARIIQLGGTPLIRPEDWYKHANCSYDAPEDPYVRTLLEQNIKGEQCAIGVYNSLLNITRDKDIVTYEMVATILKDEVEHEEDLESLLEDLDLMMKKRG